MVNMDVDAPLDYLTRISEYYQILGYGEPYRWAHFSDVPFTLFAKPLSEARIGIVTTAAPYQPEKGEQGPGAAHNGRAKFYSVYSETTEVEPDLRISHIAYDRKHSPANDQGSYFPLRALKALQSTGEFGELSPRFYGLPTNRSQKTSIEIDGPALVERCREDKLDAAILIPNCPVCHQSVSLAARALEQAGIATVIMGCARDIVVHVGVPRLLFNNFPLGNSAGLPDDSGSQLEIARLALQLLVSAKQARTTEQSPFRWNGDPDWQNDYSNANLLSAEEIARRRAEFDKTKQEAKRVREANG
ncbi:MAG: D-proline reductase (dithiol) PrdB [Planctomycetota bacterium]|jgi:D-proline reductase (dithiol) PrdB